jgi:hypothetical protein
MGGRCIARPIGNAIRVVTIMRLGETWTNFCERLRLYVASGAFSLAFFVLWLTRRMYRARLLIFSDLRYALRLGETLRRFGWRLIKLKHH